MNYKGKKYKKVRKPIHKGDLVVLHCKRNSNYFKYNGVHKVVSDFKEIHIKREGEITLCLKLGYNVLDYSKLIEVKKKKYLPMPLKEEY